MTTCVVVPVRGFATGKARLHDRLDAAEREALLESMASTVAAAAGARPVLVVTSASEVRRWAAGLGLAVIDDPGTLDAAAALGCSWWVERGASRVVVVHADLPLARTLDPVDPIAADAGTVYAVASRDGDGTPVLSLPSGAAFQFAYGPGSFGRHQDEAARLGLVFRTVPDPALAFDVDTPSDVLDLTRITSPLPA